MSLTRRQAVASALSLPLLPLLSRPDVRAADDDSALFWRFKTASAQAILFGYVRGRADAFPQVIDDGKRHIDRTDTIIADVDPATTLGSMTFEKHDLKPIFLKLPKAAQDELATIFAGSKAIPSFSNLTALELNILLAGEGQHGFSAEAPSLGGALLTYGQSLKRPVATLLARNEIAALTKPLTLDTANAVAPDSVIYLLGLRRRFGPIGAHLDNLYGARKGGELGRLGAEMRSRGVIDLTHFLNLEGMRALLIDRLSSLPAGTDAFITLPIGLLAGPDGICDALRSRGAEVTAIG
ncbi:hypothetical protein ACQKKX_19400 [Neorhizobium sp. NPDC001467]|uniref:hypothetical protein n=1 Tax=Neorhizobium sp. NPDC001467 TaxID=3390595 RepID=UPI003D01BA40